MIEQRIENENGNENDLIYSDNFIPNYEEQACCNNVIFSTFGNNSIFSYINDICFKDIPINDQEILNNIDEEVKTPLCSNKKKTPNENSNKEENNKINEDEDEKDNNNIEKKSDSVFNIGNENNNILINNERNLNLIRNSLASNPSNDSAAEPIMAIKRNNTMDIQLQNKNKNNNINNNNNNNNNTLNRNNTNANIFTTIANIFKELFDKKNNQPENKEINNNEDEKSESELSLKKRPILKTILNRDSDSPIKLKNYKNYKLKSNNNKNLHKNEKRENLYDDILILKTSEKNDENIAELVSVIPAFIVKEKNKNNECNNKHCPICLGEFMVGEKESSLPCLHCFHSNCIEKWFKRSKFCPVCKLQISWESLNPDF